MHLISLLYRLGNFASCCRPKKALINQHDHTLFFLSKYTTQNNVYNPLYMSKYNIAEKNNNKGENSGKRVEKWHIQVHVQAC